MSETKPIPGVDYWPNADEWEKQPSPPPKSPSLIVQALMFLLVFAIMQISWLFVRDHSIGHFIRGDLTVKPAVTLINTLTPTIHASAFGNQIKANGGGLVVKLGCEGVEALFILIAALVNAPLSRAAKFKGILWGTLLIYVFNQARILGLFYAFRADKSFFHFLHGTLAPLMLIAIAGLFFHWWLVKDAAKKPPVQPA
jgi:exosortase family protein XrtM